MDLIFDSQVVFRRNSPDRLPESVLESISSYYRRATTTSRPMGHLIALVMLILLGTLGFRAALGHDAGWLLVLSAALAGGPIVLALTRTLPNAVRLGSTTKPTLARKRIRPRCTTPSPPDPTRGQTVTTAGSAIRLAAPRASSDQVTGSLGGKKPAPVNHPACHPWAPRQSIGKPSSVWAAEFGPGHDAPVCWTPYRGKEITQ